MSKPESRYIVTKSEHNGVPWSDVAVQRSPGMYTVYKLTEVARGTPAELAALEDPDAPVIEVVIHNNKALWRIECGEYIWNFDDRKWMKLPLTGTAAVYAPEDRVNDTFAFLKMFKHYPQADGGAQ